MPFPAIAPAWLGSHTPPCGSLRRRQYRRGIVGTKAICQTIAHLFRILYFGSLLSAFDAQVPWWAFGGALVLAFTGTTMAAFVLERMTDADFRAWSRRIVFAVGTSLLVRGLWLFAAARFA